MKKIISIAIVIVILFVGGYYLYQFYQNERIKHAVKIVKYPEEVMVFQDITLKELITEINGKLIKNPKINTTKLGKQEISFEYITDEKIKVPYTIQINVVDKIPPIVAQPSIYTIDVSSKTKKELNQALFCGDNYDPNPKCTIEGEYDLNKVGDYRVKLVGKDSSENTTSHSFTLRVKAKSSSKSTGTSNPKIYTDFEKVKAKYKNKNTKIGIDVSHWQEDIDFEALKESGVEFAYVRVGRGDGIGKEYVLDRKFEQNMKGFNKVGIPIGVYFYSNANSREDAIKEANWMISKIKKYKVDLEIVFDWENWQYFQEYDQSFYSLTETAKAFVETVEKKGYKGMLYSSKNYLENIWFDSDMPVWLAHYTEQTNYQGNYRVWQLCENGKVNGIKGQVDINVMYTSSKKQ